MDLFFGFIAAITGLALIGAGFISLFNPRRGMEFLKNLSKGLLPYVISTALLWRFAESSSWLGLLTAFVVVSVIAYFIRQSRRPRRSFQRKPGPAERKPVFPQGSREL